MIEDFSTQFSPLYPHARILSLLIKYTVYRYIHTRTHTYIYHIIKLLFKSFSTFSIYEHFTMNTICLHYILYLLLHIFTKIRKKDRFFLKFFTPSNLISLNFDNRSKILGILSINSSSILI